MSSHLKSNKHFEKSTVKKLSIVASEVANIILIDSLAKKTVEAVTNGRTKITGIAQLFIYLQDNATVIALAKTAKTMKVIEDNEVRRKQVWDALDETIQQNKDEEKQESDN